MLFTNKITNKELLSVIILAQKKKEKFFHGIVIKVSKKSDENKSLKR